ncbi:MAG: Gx transporter family protein [Exilispira sp.]
MTALPTEKKILKFYDKKFILFFATVSAIFSYIESIIPKPLIFVKIGFAYIPILIVLDKINVLYSIVIILLKSILTGIFAGSLFSFTGILSIVGAAGSVFAFALIYLFIKKFSKVAISILLAVFTNLFQLIFYSVFIIKDYNILRLIPLINIISVIAGAITGCIAIEIEEKYLAVEFLIK